MLWNDGPATICEIRRVQVQDGRGAPWIPHHLTNKMNLFVYCVGNSSMAVIRARFSDCRLRLGRQLGSFSQDKRKKLKKLLLGPWYAYGEQGLSGWLRRRVRRIETMQLRERALPCPRSYPHRVYSHAPAWDRLGSTQDVNLLTKPARKGTKSQRVYEILYLSGS